MNKETEQQIRNLRALEEDLGFLIDRTSKSPNDHPENLKATRMLNQVQLKRLQLQVNEL
jgi:hypothetical protein